ncbi:MAG: type VI secretion system tip protein TssI/VgrG [Thermodesulfobacteriota bacterium]
MDETPTLKFSFTSRALAPDAFWVVDFHGVEGLGLDYEFELRLISYRADLDLDHILAAPAAFTIHRPDRDVVFHGLLTQIEQDQAFSGMFFYRAVLAPRLWRLKMTHHHQVFLDQDLSEFLAAVIEDGGLGRDDFELRLVDAYKKREYVCQYGESHHDFLSRWIEREGLYYFFEQGDDREKLIITDTRHAGVKRPGFPDLRYDQISGLEPLTEDRLVFELTRRHERVPGQVKTKDYNYMMPSLDLSAESEVSPDGLGEIYVWGEYYDTPEEGRRLARIRAEALKAGEVVFQGRSICPYLSPGYLFQLEGHYRNDFNAEYLVTTIEHRGSQTGYLVRGLGLDRDLGEDLHYENSFTAIPATVQYRPGRRTPKPLFSGSLNAHVDAEGSGQYAELDDQGRYKIRLPFDLATRSAGKASHWIRMAQPLAGSDYGFHAPLHKGAEVLLTFINGDPDRPIIAGAAPNPENASPVTAENLTKNVLSTAGGNRIEFDDRQGRERILIQTPQSNTWLRLGAPNDPGDDDEKKEGWWGNTEHDTGISIFGKCNTKVFRNVTNIILGGSEKIVVLHENLTVAGLDTAINLGPRIKVEYPYQTELNLGELFSGTEEEEAALSKIKLVNQHLQALNSKKQALNQKLDLVNQRAKVANDNKELIESKITAKTRAIEAYNTQVRAVQTKIEAVDQKIEAVNTQIGTNQNRIKAVNDLVEASNTVVRNAQAQILTIERERVKMGTLINDDGMIIKT